MLFFQVDMAGELPGTNKASMEAKVGKSCLADNLNKIFSFLPPDMETKKKRP